MKKTISLFALAVLLISCNKDLVEKPNNLIDKKVMGDILYDMAILDAVKYQGPDTLMAYGINPKTYIYKKYKIDSLQLVKSNAYYASDYREYKKMYDALHNRLKKEKAAVDFIIKKKEAVLKKAKAKKTKDSIAKAKKLKELKIKKEKDSLSKTKKGKELAKKEKDSINKAKKEKELKTKKG